MLNGKEGIISEVAEGKAAWIVVLWQYKLRCKGQNAEVWQNGSRMEALEKLFLIVAVFWFLEPNCRTVYEKYWKVLSVHNWKNIK